MRAEVVGVGTELLLGQIANTNARWMSERLSGIGVNVLHHQVVGDNLERIVETLRLALDRADVVIATGGLGPTADDITRDALAITIGAPLVRRPELEEMLRAKFAGFGREMPESNLRQADVPDGARYITPERGTAPGLIVQLGERRLYALPGVPAEMTEMMEGTVLPELAQIAGAGIVLSRVIRCTGVGESAAAELVDDLFAASANPSIAYLASANEVRVRITAKAASRAEAEAAVAPLVDEIARRLGDAVFSTDDEELERVLGRLLKAQRRRVACAESLTGGGLARRLTTVPGSSMYFLGSAVCYTAEAKVAVLGVSAETIEGPGVVSEECAREMASGARHVFGADVALAVTGAAGPEPHGGKPPGTAWIALEADDVRHARGFRAPGDRPHVRRWTEQAALDLLRRYLRGRPLPGSDLIG
jgi:competence/damage-inducible protein CinA-like protein